MIRCTLILLVVLFAQLSFAQITMTPAIQLVDGSTDGSNRPRIHMTGDQPVLQWTKNSSTGFIATVKGDTLVHQFDVFAEGFNHFQSSYGGTDMAALGKLIYVVGMTLPYTQAKLWTRYSTDGGASWSAQRMQPLPDSVIPFLPTIAMNADSLPSIMFMAYDSNYHNPRYVMMQSTAADSSFGTLVDVSGDQGGEVCDCCPAHLEVKGDTIIGLFRNNLSNNRDVWIATSTTNLLNFNQRLDIDPGNWNVNICPSSGPDAIFSNAVAHAVWMSGGSGAAQVYYAQFDVASQVDSSTVLWNRGNQSNYPRIAGNKDTLGVVFQNSENSQNNCIMLISTNGGHSFDDTLDITHDSTSSQSYPDVAFHNGTFHIVYRDLFSGNSIWYRKVQWGWPTSAQEPISSDVNVHPNPTTGVIRIDPLGSSNEVRVFNTNGKQVHLCANLQHSTLDLSHLPSGLYYLHLVDYESGSASRQAVVKIGE